MRLTRASCAPIRRLVVLQELQVVELAVDAVALEQLVVRADLGDLARVENDDLVGAAGRSRGGARSPASCGPAIRVSSACWTSRSDSVSSAEVASSRIRIGGFLRMRAGDREPLPLAAREQTPDSPISRVVALAGARR